MDGTYFEGMGEDVYQPSADDYADWAWTMEESEEFDSRTEEEFFADLCTNPGGHKFECTGTAYGGEDERWHGEGRCLCVYCGADGDA